MVRPSVACAITGVLLNAVGVILLFFYAMPYRVRDEGEALWAKMKSSEERQKDKRYEVRSLIGLALIILGTVLQIASILV